MNLDWLPDQNGEINDEVVPPSDSRSDDGRMLGWVVVRVVDTGAGISKVSSLT